jgi:hypothetical protein
MAKPKARDSKSKKAAKGQDETLAGTEAAFEKCLPKALSLEPGSVIPMRGDPNLALHNVQVGIEALGPHWAELKTALPKLDQKSVQGLEEVALAAVFATSRVDRKAGAGKKVSALLTKARALRAVLLSSADAMAKAGLVPAAAVKKTRTGKGALDAADDLVQLAALFRKHTAKLKNKSPVSTDMIKEAAELGSDLLAQLKPKHAKRKTVVTPEIQDAIDARDRTWTLLVQGHRDLRRAGMWVWADQVDKHVPPLQSRAAKPRKKDQG